MRKLIIKLLANDNCGSARTREKEVGVQNHELTYRNGIQGQARGRVRQAERSPRLSGHGKCRGCVGKVHALIWGGLPDERPFEVAHWRETAGVFRQKSAEATVARKGERLNSEEGRCLHVLL